MVVDRSSSKKQTNESARCIFYKNLWQVYNQQAFHQIVGIHHKIPSPLTANKFYNLSFKTNNLIIRQTGKR